MKQFDSELARFSRRLACGSERIRFDCITMSIQKSRWSLFFLHKIAQGQFRSWFDLCTHCVRYERESYVSVSPRKKGLRDFARFRLNRAWTWINLTRLTRHLIYPPERKRGIGSWREKWREKRLSKYPDSSWRMLQLSLPQHQSPFGLVLIQSRRAIRYSQQKAGILFQRLKYPGCQWIN